MELIRVNEKKRIVRTYKEDMEDDVVFNRIEKYKKLGYKVIITSRPKKYNHLKNDMIKYLEGNIKDDLYKEFIDRVEKKEKFLVTKWWLEKELEKVGNDTIMNIINRAKSKENNVIENAKQQATIENEKAKEDIDKSNKNKSKVNENK